MPRNARHRRATPATAAQLAETRIPFYHPFTVFPLISGLHLNGADGTRASATRRNAERMGGDSSDGTIVPLGGRTVQGRTVQGRTVQGRTVHGRTVHGRTVLFLSTPNNQ